MKHFRARNAVRNAVRLILPDHLIWNYKFRRFDRLSIRELCKTRAVEPELELMAPLLRQGDGAIFDVGANKGDYLYVIQKAAPSGAIYAIEPLLTECCHLSKSFPAVKVLQLALSDHEGEMALKIPFIEGRAWPTRATLENFKETGETRARLAKTRVIPLDRLCATIGVQRIRFIKIDVEGHEQSVLAGASGIIKQWLPILQVEIEQRHHQCPIDSIFNSIVQRGYHGFFFNSLERRLLPLSKFNAKTNQALGSLGTSGYINNFLFFTRDTAQQTVNTVHEELNSAG